MLKFTRISDFVGWISPSSEPKIPWIKLLETMTVKFKYQVMGSVQIS